MQPVCDLIDRSKALARTEEERKQQEQQDKLENAYRVAAFVGIAAILMLFLTVRLFQQQAKTSRLLEQEKTLLRQNKEAKQKAQFEEAKAWLERAKGHQEKQPSDTFSPALMAGRAVGYRNCGLELIPEGKPRERFAESYPELVSMAEKASREAFDYVNGNQFFPIWPVACCSASYFLCLERGLQPRWTDARIRKFRSHREALERGRWQRDPSTPGTY